MRRLRIAWFSPALLVGLALLPGFASAATLGAFLGDRRGGDRIEQVVLGFAIGVVAWLAFSLLFCRRFTHVDGAQPGIYDELRIRAATVGALVPTLEPSPDDDLATRQAKAELRAHAESLHELLRLQRDASQHDGGLRWLLAFGYVNAWRQVHRAEEALLELEPTASLLVAARIDLARLQEMSVEGKDTYVRMLQEVLADTGKIGDAEARARVRAVRYGINRVRNELWDRLVRLRNLFFATIVFNGSVAFALLALAIAAGAKKDVVVAGVAFYVVAAAIGLFGQLYAISRRKRGIVNDYGLELVRLTAVPLISGFAGLGGVLLTRMAAIAGDGVPTLEEIFSLDRYPYGLVVAAIFGLTPGLLLERLNQVTADYKDELARSGVPAPQEDAGRDEVLPAQPPGAV